MQPFCRTLNITAIAPLLQSARSMTPWKTSFESTARFLGVDVGGALNLAEVTDT